MRYWGACLWLGLLCSGTVHAIEVLVPGYLLCAEESDLADIVNSEPSRFRAVVTQKINQQKCARIPIGERVPLVVRKTLPNGRSYSCYEEEINVLTPASVHCSLNAYFMSLDKYIAAYPLQYSVTTRTAERIFAHCANGASVILERQPEYFLRTVQLPFSGMLSGQPSVIRMEESAALLGGCRGDDFLLGK